MRKVEVSAGRKLKGTDFLSQKCLWVFYFVIGINTEDSLLQMMYLVKTKILISHHELAAKDCVT